MLPSNYPTLNLHYLQTSWHSTHFITFKLSGTLPPYLQTIQHSTSITFKLAGTLPTLLPSIYPGVYFHYLQTIRHSTSITFKLSGTLPPPRPKVAYHPLPIFFLNQSLRNFLTYSKNKSKNSVKKIFKIKVKNVDASEK